MTKRLAIIDGMSVFYRGYYAMPSFSTADGTPTGGVYGFTALALEVIKKLKPDYVAVAWDKPKTNTRARKAIYPQYKAGRKPTPEDFKVQIPLLHELLQAFSWPLLQLDDFEADDIMGSLAAQASKKGIETCLVTGDLDMLQVVGPLTHLYAMKKGFSNIELFNPETFEAKYGLRVEQFLDLKALKGDSSDNLPGVPGVGEKTAIDLLQKYETLDGVYQHLDETRPVLKAKLEAGKKSAYLTKEVGRIWIDAPCQLNLKTMDTHDVDPKKLAELLHKFEFKSLLAALPAHMKAQTELGDATVTNDLKPAKITPLDDAKKVGHRFVIAASAGGWLVSPSAGTAYLVKNSDIEPLLGDASIIAYDAKLVLKQLLAAGVSQLPTVHHDVRQAAFLLNPLRRSRALADLAGASFEGDDGSLEVAAVWSLYTDHEKQFDSLSELATLARTIDFAVVPLLARMEHRGIILDTEALATMQKKLAGEIGTLTKTIHSLAGYDFNINSPSQLADVLYGTLALPTVGIKKGKTGYSTGIRELEKLRALHPIIEAIEKYRELTKLQSTYVEALPKLVDTKSRLHTDFRQDVAATGRLSSADPNLQNIPVSTPLGRTIREAFVPSPGNVFISADYSQFELRLAAVLSQDKQLIADFESDDIDIHTKTASDVFGVKPGDVTKTQRRAAKVINFGVLYGMSPHGLAAATGMTFSDAKKFIDDYFALRAPIRMYIDTTIEKAKTDGYVQTLFGRRRPTPDVVSSNYLVREGAKRAAANMPIQGTEADLMKLAMLAVEQKLVELRSKNKSDVPAQLLQIHDSILLEAPKKDAEALAKMLKNIMQDIYPKLGVKLKVDVSIGDNWGEVK